MTSLTITITGTSPEGFTAEVLTDAKGGVNRQGLRSLIMSLAAGEQELKPSDMVKAGFDGQFDEGWEVESDLIPGGRRRIKFKVRRRTQAEIRTRLRERGGFVENSDGSMGFIMPQPKARKAHRTPAPQAKPAEPTSPERVKRPRLR